MLWGGPMNRYLSYESDIYQLCQAIRTAKTALDNTSVLCIQVLNCNFSFQYHYKISVINAAYEKKNEGKCLNFKTKIDN